MLRPGLRIANIGRRRLTGLKDAKIMDTTVTEGCPTRSHGSVAVALREGLTVYPRSLDLRHTEGACLTRPFARKVLVFVSLVSFAVLSLFLTGCRLIGGSEAVQAPVASTPRSGTARTVTPAATPAPSSPKSPATLAATTQSVPETKRPPAATASRGAERLMAQSSPALPRSNETFSQPAVTRPAASPSASPPAIEGGPEAASTVKELIVKGPPRVRQPRSTERNRRLWTGLVFGSALVAFGALLVWQRRGKSSSPVKSDKEELVMPKDFLIKEPANLPKWDMNRD